MDASEIPQLTRKQWVTGCLVVLLLIGISLIVGYLGLSHSDAVQNKAKLATVKGNMHTLQLAIESYATDCGGQYPQSLKDVLPYFPQGGNKINGLPGKMPDGSVYLDYPVPVEELGNLRDHRQTLISLQSRRGIPNTTPCIAFCRSNKASTYEVFQIDASGYPDPNRLRLSNR